MSAMLTTDVLADLVKETTTTTGMGTITLAGADTSTGPAQSFASGVGVGNTCLYRIACGTTLWEVGRGTVGGSGPYTLSRDTVFAGSSGPGNHISLTGTSQVACVAPAQMSPFGFNSVVDWNNTSAWAAYSFAYYKGDVYVSTAPIAAPTGSTALSSATTASPTTATSWSLNYSTSGRNRLIYLLMGINSGSASLVTNVSSPNVTWTKRIEDSVTGFGYQSYASLWVGVAGPQLTNEPITITLAGSYAGVIIAVDAAGLNLGGQYFDPNTALPADNAGVGSGTLSGSYTTSNADDTLIYCAMTGNTPISTTPSGFTQLANVNLGIGLGSLAMFYENVTATQSGVSVTDGSGQAWIVFTDAIVDPISPGNPTPDIDTRWSRITNLSLQQAQKIVSKTANYTVLTTDNGTQFDNQGATGAVTFTLPTAAAGLVFSFMVDAAQTVTVTASGSDKIAVGLNNGSAGGSLASADPYSYIELRCHKAGQWVVTSTIGDFS